VLAIVAPIVGITISAVVLAVVRSNRTPITSVFDQPRRWLAGARDALLR
jgi:hypothetical protein